MVNIEQEQKRLRKVIDQGEEMMNSLEGLISQLKLFTESKDSLDINSVFGGFQDIQVSSATQWLDVLITKPK